MHIIDKILENLTEQGKSQKDLCDYLGIGKQSFSDWKSGRSTTYTKYIPQIAEFLGVSIETLYGIEKDEVSEYLDELKNREEMRMLFSVAKNATKEDIERAVAIIEALRKHE